MSDSSSRAARRSRPDPQISKDYKGTVLMPLHLIFPELWPLKCTVGPSAGLEDLWAIGTRHPWGVYGGPTTGVTRRVWREMGTTGLAGVVVKAASEYRGSGQQEGS
jgi:hypothetical protein